MLDLLDMWEHVNENKSLEGPYKFVGKQMYSYKINKDGIH
jgi:hypothetical protein